MRNLLFLMAFLTLVTSGCGARKGAGKTGGAGTASKAKASQVIKAMEQNAFTTQYMEGSARIKLASEKLNISGTATIRLERDKAIWMSVKKFGLEGARALIRPDSFFVYNRLNGDYTAEPLSYITEKYKVPARFDLLQEIVLGNAVFFTRNLDLKTVDGYYELRGADTRYVTDYVVAAGNYQLQRMSLAEKGTDRRVSITNADFKAVPRGKGAFAYERKVMVDSEDSGEASVELDFNRIELGGPFAMPFRQR
ncbi:DUF4292 domain-containing protein [Neolewinella antarctica]|uniref:DUF4292 domain-containing protein n=1 Tax=Neolewinella antarctica TaxID=442734 RepID=A0ABX0XD89_9BACT|nr:DUF4292 domain-containing protein [Neolewinella antarctica]NJC27266.1 hypothetical protein [Neolewinella antarctica]